jgi:hypothetical protein
MAFEEQSKGLGAARRRPARIYITQGNFQAIR